MVKMLKQLNEQERQLFQLWEQIPSYPCEFTDIKHAENVAGAIKHVWQMKNMLLNYGQQRFEKTNTGNCL